MQKAVILTAGLGKRMLPLTRCIPKALLPLGMKTAAQVVAQECIESGATKLCFVVAPDSPLPDYFDYCSKNDDTFKNVEFTFVCQQKPIGSGNALLCAEEFCKKDRFFLANCDEVFSQNAFLQLSKLNGISVGVKKVKPKNACMYGILQTANGVAQVIEEKPQNRDFASAPLALVGRFLLDGRIFDCLKQISFVGGELRLTDALNVLFAKNQVYARMLNGKRFDVGSPEGYKNAFNYFSF